MSAMLTPSADGPAAPNPGQQPLFAAGATARERKDFAAELRRQTVACRVRREKFGVRRALTREEVGRAADEFGAEASAITAAKRLIDTTDPSWRAVTGVLARATAYWRACSTPYPEPGVRLIRKSSVETFGNELAKMRAELREAARQLQEHYADLREQARVRLGELFDADDYPDRVDTEFSLAWDFPSIDPPAYLKDLHPAIYEQEQAKVRGRFEEAIRLTEEAMAAQLRDLVAHLVDKLTGTVDGKPKVIRESAVTNLVEFFDAFKAVDLGSNVELQQLVQRAQDAVNGVGVGDLRDDEHKRASVSTALAGVRETLDALMVAKPKRAISLEDE